MACAEIRRKCNRRYGGQLNWGSGINWPTSKCKKI